MVSVGKVLADKYRIESQLGRGGMGSVWLAQHLTLGSHVAIKLIAGDVAQSESVRRRFLHEAKAAAGLVSPYVVQIFDYGIDEGLPFIVMERLVGETLGEALAREVTLSPALTAQIITHVGRGVQNAHDAGIVHRDLKPDNIFLTHNDDELVAKVLDFGVAKTPKRSDETAGTTLTGTLLGSPLYMSPEQAHGGKELDFRSDLWSLGVIAFQCLTGQVPFPGKGWGELVAKICRDSAPVPSTIRPVPEGFDEWFERATRKAREERFASCRELVEALRKVLVPPTGAPRMISTPAAATPVRAGDLPANSSDPTLDLIGSTQRSPVPGPAPQVPIGPELQAQGVHESETLAASSHGPVVTTTPESTNAPVASSDPPLSRSRRSRAAVVAMGALLLVAASVVVWSIRQPPSVASEVVDSSAQPLDSNQKQASAQAQPVGSVEATVPPSATNNPPQPSASASTTARADHELRRASAPPRRPSALGRHVAKPRPTAALEVRRDAATNKAAASAKPATAPATPAAPVSADILRERE